MAARWAGIPPWQLAAAPKGWRDMIELSAAADAVIQTKAQRA